MTATTVTTGPTETEALVAKALVALEQYGALDQEQVDLIVGKASVAALRQHVRLAQLAVDETGRGVVEDKAVKNIFACEHAFQFPSLGELAQLVCIPTTSGSGSEVTPFAVITDTATGHKYPLADYALTPQVAIIDSTLTEQLPATVTADSGIDVLVHATEAYTSVYANDFTDGLCLQAIKLVFENLERVVADGSDEAAREKMHNAGTIAGMAFANAFLGICHATAHTVGARFHIAHGRTNGILLPHVIRYNGQVPSKLSGWPKYDRYQAPERFLQIAQMLGLPAESPEQAVESYARACEELRDAIGIPASFQELNVDEDEFLAALPEMAVSAYEDQCAPANPRMPMLDGLTDVMRAGYYGSVEAEQRAANAATSVGGGGSTPSPVRVPAPAPR